MDRPLVPTAVFAGGAKHNLQGTEKRRKEGHQRMQLYSDLRGAAKLKKEWAPEYGGAMLEKE